MRDEITNALTSVVDRLVGLALEDATMKSHLRRLALAILAATESTPDGVAKSEEPQASVMTEESLPATLVLPTVDPQIDSVAIPLAERPAITEVLSHPARVEEEILPPVPRWSEIEDTELPLIEAR